MSRSCVSVFCGVVCGDNFDSCAAQQLRNYSRQVSSAVVCCVKHPLLCIFCSLKYRLALHSLLYASLRACDLQVLLVLLLLLLESCEGPRFRCKQTLFLSILITQTELGFIAGPPQRRPTRYARWGIVRRELPLWVVPTVRYW